MIEFVVMFASSLRWGKQEMHIALFFLGNFLVSGDLRNRKRVRE
jgi:hypothetical protein